MRAALVCSLVASIAACGGSPKDPTAFGGGLGSTHVEGALDPTASTTPPTPAIDQAAAFRATFENPGGMWMPEQLASAAHAQVLAQLGVTIPGKTLADPLADPLGAIVQLGGCSGSFVSPDGLIVTNNHCVRSALQMASTAGNDLVEHGFYATTRAAEISAGAAQRVYVAQAFTDVTTTITSGLADFTDANARHDAAEHRSQALVSACEAAKAGVRCRVASYFKGQQYVLIENAEIRDLRLVYAPARSIGNFGGETDNWHWPRHTGDFAFYRAYVGKDGLPADYSPDNVPYHPAHHLHVTDAGLKQGDFVMVAGYPASTSRTQMAMDTRFQAQTALPYTLEYYNQLYALADAHSHDAGETGIKAGVMRLAAQNRQAKSRAILAALTAGDLVVRKEALDTKITAWAKEPGRESYLTSIDEYQAHTHLQQLWWRVDFDRSHAYDGSRLLAAAFQITRWSMERAKPDAERRTGYQDRDLRNALDRQRQLDKQYDAKLDRETLRLVLVRALPEEANREWLKHLLGVKQVSVAAIDKAIDRWYATSKLTSTALRVKLMTEGTAKSLAAAKDPFLEAVARAWPDYLTAERKGDADSASEMVLAPVYMDAMRQALGGDLAPDANGTLRITYGTVRGSTGADAFTTAAQIPAKSTGTAPFDAPPKLLAAVAAHDYGGYADAALRGELAVDFESDLDTTGGNSGSATLNANGQLVGLLFDGTLDGVSSDLLFDPTVTRAIHVDVRYLLWVLHRIDGADALIAELAVDHS